MRRAKMLASGNSGVMFHPHIPTRRVAVAMTAESEAERLREAGFINQSLSALGNVVAALGQAEQNRPHIPFR